MGSSLRHTGIGDPQKRLRLIDQSRAPSSHMPKRPSRTWPGTQLMSELMASIRSLMSVTFTNQDEMAL